MQWICLLSIALGLMAVGGCVRGTGQQCESSPITGASAYDLTDTQVRNLSAKASTNAASAYRLYQFYELAHFDQESAMKWLNKAAEGGHAEAQYSLSVFLTYLPGYMDLEQSRAWLIKSAAQGYAPAKQMQLKYQK
jgi:TPR repeat protein